MINSEGKVQQLINFLLGKKPAGYLILTTPNLTRVALKWLMMGPFRFLKSVQDKRDYVMKMFYGPQSAEGMVHKSGYDAGILKSRARAFGFKPLLTVTPYPNRPTPSLLMIAEKITFHKA